MHLVSRHLKIVLHHSPTLRTLGAKFMPQRHWRCEFWTDGLVLDQLLRLLLKIYEEEEVDVQTKAKMNLTFSM